MSKDVCVIGMGRVGLPLACVLALSGYTVHGVDINESVIAQAQTTHWEGLEPELQQLLHQAVERRLLTLSQHIAPAGTYVIAVPTLLTEDNQADTSQLYAAIATLKPHLRPKTLVLIESTCPIGTTQNIAQMLQKDHTDIWVAYCPERVLPGNIVHELIYNDRVVGGVDAPSTLSAAAFYRSFVKGEVSATDARTAEAVKLAENAYRDINIAYANELSMIADRLGLDVHQVIRLANRHPRVQILKPGVGVGGHCIAMDPWYLVSAEPDLAQLTAKARLINIKKTDWVVQKARHFIREKNAHIIACLGLTYKPNISDIRASPALAVVQALEKEVEVLRVDPHVLNTASLLEALARAEVIVVLVGHQLFTNITRDQLDGKPILDFTGVLS